MADGRFICSIVQNVPGQPYRNCWRLNVNDIEVVAAIFGLIEDDQLRAQYPILFSEHFVEKSVATDLVLKRIVWALDESNEYLFEEISAAKFISRETWTLNITSALFTKFSIVINTGNERSIEDLVSLMNDAEVDFEVFDLEDVPPAAISGYSQHYSSVEIGQELREWFGEEVADLDTFPVNIRPMLERSLELASQWENEKELERSRRRQKFELADEAGVIHLSLGSAEVSRVAGLGQGLVVVDLLIKGGGPSGFLKARKLTTDIAALKANGHRVIELNGVFAGEPTTIQSCRGVANVTEAEAIDMIGRTDIRIGLYFYPNGICKVIDLDG